MKQHLSKKERKKLGKTHALKTPKAKHIENPGNKGRDYFIEVTKAKNGK